MDAPALFRAPPARPVPPLLDAAQQRVVRHPGGPLLVLAGPGTGKTTTLVETAVHRVQERGLAPEQVLLLTFSRRAAQELRERVTARLGRTTAGPLAMTFHSYAYALLRRESAAVGGPPQRLLSGPEQDLEVARLLDGEVTDGAVRWRAQLRPALRLAGFREQLRDLVLRAQERGLDGAALRELGRATGRVDWESAGLFLADYAARFALDPAAQVLDYASLVRSAADLLEVDGALRLRERDAHPVVLVDEYQDTDPAQVRLLRALAGDGRDLVAVGDPDQSVYGFRGADVRGILDFPEVFRTASGAPAAVQRLRSCRRCGPRLLAASRAVAARLPAGRLGPAFRDLVADGAAVPGPGELRVRLAATPTAEAAVVADVLRRAHLVDGVAWSDMAVLVRSTPRSLAGLRRGLLAADVPVAVSGDEVPLAQEPVVAGLLDLVHAALRPAAVDEDVALALLTGPVVRADPLAVRALRRALREADTRAGRRTASGPLLVHAVLGLPADFPAGSVPAGGDPAGGDPAGGDPAGGDPAGGDPAGWALPGPAAAPTLRLLHRLLRAARQVAAAGGSAEDVLWAVWDAGGLAGRYERASAQGGARGAVADRALDAVIALFDAAARYVDRLPGAGVLTFVDDVRAQEVPADSLAQRTPGGECVRILTAHAAKGLQWRVVVVAGVQEGVWPDLRLRGSLLGADALAELACGRDPAVDPRAALLAEERRLFYVAVTRARELLVVTAVRSGEDGQERPSRFLEELGVPVPDAVTPVGRPLTPAGLVAELRIAATSDPEPAVREAACRRLARLAAGGQAASTPTAHPERWWGLAPLSDEESIVGPGETVRVSPSKVESFDTCALRWFLESAVGVSGGAGPPQVLGSLVHALCELASGPQALDETAVQARLDAVLPELDLGAPWAARRRRQDALAWLGKFVRWAAGSGRALVATELELRVPLAPQAELRGRVDRLERDEHGRAVVVDLKTGSKPKKADLPRHPQLGAYQLAVELGGFLEQGLTVSGGAALLQLKEGATAVEQRQPPLGEDDDPQWARALVDRVVTGMRGSTFRAHANEHCERCPVRSCCPLWPQGQGVLR